jgi:Uma2 family endonuclease
MMATLPAIKPIKAADVARLKNDKTVEIINGEWMERPMAGELHGALEANLVILLGGFVKASKLGRVYTGNTTFVLEGTPENIITMRLPDVAFVSAARVKATDRAGFYYQAPDLAIEIVSPSEHTVDTQAKVNDYLRRGTREVWVVYPDTQQISVLRPDGTATIYGVGQHIPGGDLLPGFSLDVTGVFEV